MPPTYTSHLLELSDDLHRKTLEAFHPTPQGLLKPAHSYVINLYVSLRTIQDIDYDPHIHKVTGIQPDFTDVRLFSKNRGSIFVPEKVVEFIEAPAPYRYLPPSIPADTKTKAQLGLFEFCIDEALDKSRKSSIANEFQSAINYASAETPEEKFRIGCGAMMAKQNAHTEQSCLGNLIFGLEALRYYKDGKHTTEWATQLGLVDLALIELSEEIHHQNLDQQAAQDLVIWRHLKHRADLFKDMNPQ